MDDSAIETISKNIRTITEGAGFTEFLRFLMELSLLFLLCFLIYYLIHIGNKHIEGKHRVNIGKRQIYLFVIIFLIVLLMIFMFRIRGLLYDILAPFIFAIVLAYILNPMVSYLQHKGIQRIWGVFIVYFTMLSILTLLSITLIPRFTLEIGD